MELIKHANLFNPHAEKKVKQKQWPFWDFKAEQQKTKSHNSLFFVQFGAKPEITKATPQN